MGRDQLILNRYRPMAEAGTGGFGTVQVAWDTRIQRKVAIKCIELNEFDAMRAQWPDENTHVLAEAGAPAAASAVAPVAMPVAAPAAVPPVAANSWRAATDDAGFPWDDLGADSFGEPFEAADSPYRGPDDDFSSDFADDSYGNPDSLSPESPYGGLQGDAFGDFYNDAVSGFPEDGFDDFSDSPSALPDDFTPERSLAHVPGLDEARTAAMLTDANIVAVYDFEVQGTTAYLIMEYVEGVTLTQLLRRHADALTLDIAAAVFSSVAHALEVAHANQVLHLDIKPDNVLINRQGQVKVTDFGLATLADASGFGTTGGGTIGYMPLEQMRQENLDARSDEWALASLTYEMLTGQNPFLASDLEHAENAIEDAELVLPSLCWGDMDEGVDDVLFFALDPDREERYETVEAFTEAMEPYLGDAKRGHKELAMLVGDAEEETEPEAAPVPHIPLMERISDRAGAVVARMFAVAGTALVAVLGAANLPPVDGWGSPLLWGLVALCVAGAALKPHVGAFLSFVLLGVSMAFAGAPLVGIALVLATAAWWWFAGREGNAAACAVLAGPLLGVVGMAPMAPAMAGCFLGVRRAAITAVFSGIVAFALSGYSIGGGFVPWGYHDAMAGWNIVAALPNGLWLSLFPGTESTGFIAALASPSAWCTLASWVVAAVLFSVFCLRGTKTFDVLGAVVAFAVLAAGACGAAWLYANSALWVPVAPSFASLLPSFLPGAVVAGVLGIVAAAMGVPDRVRWEPEEKD